jgi:Cytochrome c
LSIDADECSGCHTPNGRGATGLFPSLNGTPMVQQSDATTLIRVVLRGALSVATQPAPTGPEMPAFGWILTDDQIADVLTYIRNSWGNSASSIDADAVKKQRETLVNRRNCLHSREVDHPNNSKDNDHRGQAQAEHEPDIMPGNALPGLPGRDDRTPFRIFGRTHYVLLAAVIGPFSRIRLLGLRVQPIVDVSAYEILGQAVALLKSALQLVAAAIDLSEIIVGQLTPLLLDLAFGCYPVPFDTVPIHFGHLPKRPRQSIAEHS